MKNSTRKPVKPAPTPHESTGLKLENVHTTLPPDNEHTNEGIIAMADAVKKIAEALGTSADALKEVARNSQKAGVYIGNCSFSALDVGMKVK